jgi:hypothetical protein
VLVYWFRLKNKILKHFFLTDLIGSFLIIIIHNSKFLLLLSIARAGKIDH